MSPVIRIPEDEQDEMRELQIELDYQASLTTEQRFEMMLKKSIEMASELIRRGYRKPFEIIKRS